MIILSCSLKFECHERQFADNIHVRCQISGTVIFRKRKSKLKFLTK